MVMEGAEKQAGRLWDKFGMKEVVKEKCDMLYVGVGHHHKAMACVCHTKLEGDISVSDGEIQSKFEWWDTTRACRSHRRRAPVWRGVEKKQACVCYIWSAMHTEARRKKRHSLIWKSERARLSGTRTFDPAAQKGRSRGGSLG